MCIRDRAEKEFRQAWQQAPEAAPEKGLYKIELTRLEGLIASGAALEIEKEAEGKSVAEPLMTAPSAEDGPRRDAGKTVVRRKTDGKGASKKKGRGKSKGSAKAKAEAKAEAPEPVKEPAASEAPAKEPAASEAPAEEPAASEAPAKEQTPESDS